MVEFLKAPFSVLHYFNYTLITFLMILSVTIYADDTTLYSKCQQVSDLLQQLALASELKSDLR